MVGTWLRAADGAAPVLLSVNTPVAFSPNGDGFQDTLVLAATFNKSVAWQLTSAARAPACLARPQRDRRDVSLALGRHGQRPARARRRLHVAIGRNRRLGQRAADAFGDVHDRHDAADAHLDVRAGRGTSRLLAQRRRRRRPLDRRLQLGGPGTSTRSSRRPTDRSCAASPRMPRRPAAATVAWDGRSDAGSGVADGQYTVALTARDAAGNVSAPIAVPVIVFRALSSVGVSATVFYPAGRRHARAVDEPRVRPHAERNGHLADRGRQRHGRLLAIRRSRAGRRAPSRWSGRVATRPARSCRRGATTRS